MGGAAGLGGAGGFQSGAPSAGATGPGGGFQYGMAS